MSKNSLSYKVGSGCGSIIGNVIGIGMIGALIVCAVPIFIMLLPYIVAIGLAIIIIMMVVQFLGGIL